MTSPGADGIRGLSPAAGGADPPLRSARGRHFRASALGGGDRGETGEKKASVTKQPQETESPAAARAGGGGVAARSRLPAAAATARRPAAPGARSPRLLPQPRPLPLPGAALSPRDGSAEQKGRAQAPAHPRERAGPRRAGPARPTRRAAPPAARPLHPGRSSRLLRASTAPRPPHRRQQRPAGTAPAAAAPLPAAG